MISKCIWAQAYMHLYTTINELIYKVHTAFVLMSAPASANIVVMSSLPCFAAQ